jgi:hypothetical protein
MLPWNLPIGAHVILTAWMFCSGSLLRMLLFVLERLLVGGRSVFFFGIFSFFPHIFVLVNCVIPRPFSYALMLFGGIGGFVTFVSALCVCLSVLDMILINSTYKLVLLLHFELVDSPVERSLFFLRRVIMLPPASLLPFPRASLSLSLSIRCSIDLLRWPSHWDARFFCFSFSIGVSHFLGLPRVCRFCSEDRCAGPLWTALRATFCRLHLSTP